ncbi:CTLH/CRA C-terminal to lish motif domain-domain-containing protein [Absidia repens]|uniref:CTLH/CRA C-terminal to lish motif domain-domain-containing protein n=1 Tax=Absidia repens TaxID=90262 RepID=A0A1X2IQD3_9FUNG|nr:CTLH/CRA C-terminal to lish motif domain-domain-containing protein [Absidia repens]
MDTLIAASIELEQRHQKYQDATTTKLDTFKKLLEKVKDNINNNEPSQTTATLESLREKAKKLQFQRTQKDFQSALSKFGKDVDRKFKQDVSVIYQPDSFAGKEHLLQRALAMHFIRQGQFDMCDNFMTEMTSSHGMLPDTEDLSVNDPALVAVVDDLKSQFRQMYTIIKQLGQEHKLDEAIRWAQEHRQELNGLSSSLEFNLHRLQFLQLLTAQQPLDAISYGRQHFSQFGDKHFSEIRRLMTSTIYKDIQSSPYAYLCSPNLWVDVQHEFQRDFCSLLNMSAESPLYASVYVGTTALPIIMKLHKIMVAKRAEWSQQDELPVEIPMEDDLRFHSVFACPESLARLSKNSRYGRNALRFKCPYCPSESGVDEAVQVTF